MTHMLKSTPFATAKSNSIHVSEYVVALCLLDDQISFRDNLLKHPRRGEYSIRLNMAYGISHCAGMYSDDEVYLGAAFCKSIFDIYVYVSDFIYRQCNVPLQCLCGEKPRGHVADHRRSTTYGTLAMGMLENMKSKDHGQSPRPCQ